MDEQLKTLLKEEIIYEFDQLRGFNVETAEYKAGIDNLVKLYDRAIEVDKAENERTDRLSQHESELEMKNRQIDEQINGRIEETALKREQFEEDRKDRIVKNVLALLQIGVPTLTAVVMTYKTFEFEKEGTVTSIFGKGWVNKLLPRK